MATNQVFRSSGDRADIPNVIMVLTDGGSNDKTRTIQAAIEVSAHVSDAHCSENFSRNSIATSTHSYQHQSINIIL